MLIGLRSDTLLEFYTFGIRIIVEIYNSSGKTLVSLDLFIKFKSVFPLLLIDKIIYWSCSLYINESLLYNSTELPLFSFILFA